MKTSFTPLQRDSLIASPIIFSWVSRRALPKCKGRWREFWAGAAAPAAAPASHGDASICSILTILKHQQQMSCQTFCEVCSFSLDIWSIFPSRLFHMILFKDDCRSKILWSLEERPSQPSSVPILKAWDRKQEQYAARSKGTMTREVIWELLGREVVK